MNPRKIGFFLTALAVALAPRIARGDDMPARPSSADDAAAYCHYVTGIADSESALDLAPRLFGTLGVVSGADAPTGATALPPTTRLIGGVSYSVAGLYRGLNVGARAEAECDRYRLVSQLHAFVEGNKDGLSMAALEAKAAVVEGALPRAEQILLASQAALSQSRTTLEEVHATELRVDALRILASRTRLDMQSISGYPAAPAGPLSRITRAREEAEERVETYDARIRESHGWDVTVRGGYDQIFGLRDYVPLFGAVTLEVNIGWLLQHGPNRRAIEGRRLWARRQVEGVTDRAEQLARRLRGMQGSEQARLRETSTLLADLEARQKTIEALGGEKARAYGEYLWFDLVKIKAEHEYLRVHVNDLATILGDPAAAPHK